MNLCGIGCGLVFFECRYQWVIPGFREPSALRHAESGFIHISAMASQDYWCIINMQRFGRMKTIGEDTLGKVLVRGMQRHRGNYKKSSKSPGPMLIQPFEPV